MNFKKMFYIILFVVGFLLTTNVSALCYNKCENGTNCYYVSDCDALGKVTCTVVSDSYCNPEQKNYDDELKSCGGGYINEIPAAIPVVIGIVYKVILIAVPIVLVIIGSIDLLKGITSQKEDEIKKSRQIFIKRLIYAGVVFFVFVVVKFVISVVADTTGNSIIECAECFIEGKCD